MDNLKSPGSTVAWPASLGVATVLGSYILACLFPFAAFAALAALTMRFRSGLALVTAAWAANQFVGFFLLSFPWDAQAVGHGIAILAAALAAFGIALVMVKRGGGSIWVRGGAALVAAFAVQQVALRAYAQFGGGAENFSAEIVTAVAINDALWFAGLLALRFVIAQMTGQKAIPAAA